MKQIERLRERLGGVTSPKMQGDNLAILLCSHFDNPDQDEDENGWTEDAIAGMYEVLDAIHNHYTGHIDALEVRDKSSAKVLDATGQAAAQHLKRAEAAERALAEAVKERDALRSASTIIRQRDEAVEVLSGIKWRSDDKDNMEFAARITYSQMDRLRAFLAKMGEK